MLKCVFINWRLLDSKLYFWYDFIYIQQTNTYNILVRILNIYQNSANRKEKRKTRKIDRNWNGDMALILVTVVVSIWNCTFHPLFLIFFFFLYSLPSAIPFLLNFVCSNCEMKSTIHKCSQSELSESNMILISFLFSFLLLEFFFYFFFVSHWRRKNSRFYAIQKIKIICRASHPAGKWQKLYKKKKGMKETFESFLMVINTSFSVLVSAQLYKVKFLQTIKSKKELFVGFKYKKCENIK